MKEERNTYFLKDLSEPKISNGAFNDPTKVGSGYRLINVSDLYTEPDIDVTKLKLLSVPAKDYEKFSVKKGDIFFTRSSLKLEGIAHCNIFSKDVLDVIYECHIMRVRPRKDIVIPEYLKEYCRSDFARKYFMRHAKTTTMTTIDQGEIGGLPVVLPSIKSQRKAVDLLSTFDSAIDKTERLIEAKEKWFKWLIKSLINDQRWKHLRSEKIFDNVSDKNHPNEELLSVTQDRGVIPRHMLGGRVMSPDGSTASYKLIKRGDFVISLRSFQGGVEYSEYQGIVSPAYTVLRNKLPISTDFYRHFFKSYIFIEKYLRIAVIGIRDGKQISMPDFKSVKLPYPPIEDQEKVATVLNAAQKEIGLLKHKLDLLKKQKRGLMQKLLTGQWRV